MKRTLRLLLTVGLSLVCVSLFAQKFPNYPIPQQPDTLRILGIGNSFTDDGMMYLPELLEAAGIRNVVLGRLYIAGCSLERHCREYAGNAPAYIYYKSTSNRWETVSKKATLLDGIADERWDVVVQQKEKQPVQTLKDYLQGNQERVLELIKQRVATQHTGADLARLYFALQEEELLSGCDVATFHRLLAQEMPNCDLKTVRNLQVSVKKLNDSTNKGKIKDCGIERSFINEWRAYLTDNK